MKCREGELLISPRLNGDFLNDIDADLAAHLVCCEACAREMALQNRISLALKEMSLNEIQAPAGLCEMVMGNIQTERRSFISRFPLAWRKGVAAAAALLLLAGGSLSLTFKFADSAKILVLGPAPQTSVEPGATADPDGKETYIAMGPAGTQPGQTTAPGDPLTTKEPPADNNSLPGTSENTIVSPVITEGLTFTGQPTGGETKWLSSNMVITSTVLKYDVDDLAAAKIRAVSLAAGAGAGTQVFPEQDGDKEIVVLRLTIDSGSAPGLIAGFTSLGQLADRNDESRNITSIYNETLVKYNDLQSRIIDTHDAEEKQQLETKAYAYEQQLEAWKAEAGKRIIMLWLESM